MICPNCKTEINLRLKSIDAENLILGCLSEARSIQDISRITKIPRSTLVYHLNNLKAKNLVKSERILIKMTGRPTLYKKNE